MTRNLAGRLTARTFIAILTALGGAFSRSPRRRTL